MDFNYIDAKTARFLLALKDRSVYESNAYRCAYSEIIKAIIKGNNYCHFTITEKDDKIGQLVIDELRNAGFRAEVRLDRKVDQFMVEVKW